MSRRRGQKVLHTAFNILPPLISCTTYFTIQRPSNNPQNGSILKAWSGGSPNALLPTFHPTRLSRPHGLRHSLFHLLARHPPRSHPSTPNPPAIRRSFPLPFPPIYYPVLTNQVHPRPPRALPHHRPHPFLHHPQLYAAAQNQHAFLHSPRDCVLYVKADEVCEELV